jgi:hypothetical protein
MLLAGPGDGAQRMRLGVAAGTPVPTVAGSLMRALADLAQARVLLLSLAPLLLGLLSAGSALGLLWEPGLRLLRRGVDALTFMRPAFDWLRAYGVDAAELLARLGLLLAALALVVLVVLLLTNLLALPTLLRWVAERRHPALARRGAASLLGSLAHALPWTAAALALLLLSLPLWLLPPLALLLPALIGGWLSARLMSYDALSEHASTAERALLQQRHRASWLALGLLGAAFGMAPALLWLAGLLAWLLLPLVALLSLWLYVMAFMLTALAFVHFALDALAALRSEPLDAEAHSLKG